MKILVNGSSISRGPESWPYRLQEATGCDLLNLAQASCGYDYVFETTVTELAQESYDLVLVMWPESGRLDFRVKNILDFDDSLHTSLYQSQRNIQDKQPLAHYHHPKIQNDWIFSFGLRPPGGFSETTVDHLLQPLHRVIGHSQILESELIKIISLQSILKQQGMPYLFMFWQPFKRFDRFDHYYNMIDWNNIYTDDYLESIDKRLGSVDATDRHPKQAVHQEFANQIMARLNL